MIVLLVTKVAVKTMMMMMVVVVVGDDGDAQNCYGEGNSCY